MNQKINTKKITTMKIIYSGVMFAIYYLNFLSNSFGQNSFLDIESIKLVKELSSDYKITLKNIGEDSIVFPIGYIQPDLIFLDSSVNRTKKVNLKIAYPESNYQELSDSTQQLIIEQNCRPLVNSNNFVIIGPGDNLDLFFNLISDGFIDYNFNSKYSVKINIYVSEVIKPFCPLIWSGSIKKVLILDMTSTK